MRCAVDKLKTSFGGIGTRHDRRSLGRNYAQCKADLVGPDQSGDEIQYIAKAQIHL